MNAFQHIIVWLKLGDLSLLNSCVELVIKGFDLASEEDFKVQDQIVEQLWKYSKRLKATTISCQSLKNDVDDKSQRIE